jgi:hypothetical protein
MKDDEHLSEQQPAFRCFKASGKCSVGGPVTTGIRASGREKPPIDKITPNPVPCPCTKCAKTRYALLFRQHHSTTTMTGIKEAIAECGSVSSCDKIPRQKTADKQGVIRSPLTRRHRCETRSREEVSISHRNLQPQQETELPRYIEN